MPAVNAHPVVVRELVAYFTGSFGNASRIDYGTGHELAFLAFLCALHLLGYFDHRHHHHRPRRRPTAPASPTTATMAAPVAPTTTATTAAPTQPAPLLPPPPPPSSTTSTWTTSEECGQAIVFLVMQRFVPLGSMRMRALHLTHTLRPSLPHAHSLNIHTNIYTLHPLTHPLDTGCWCGVCSACTAWNRRVRTAFGDWTTTSSCPICSGPRSCTVGVVVWGVVLGRGAGVRCFSNDSSLASHYAAYYLKQRPSAHSTYSYLRPPMIRHA